MFAAGRGNFADAMAAAGGDLAVLEGDHEIALQLVTSGVIERRLQIINIQHGPKPVDSIGMPVAAWILGECLLHWAGRWKGEEVSFYASFCTSTALF